MTRQCAPALARLSGRNAKTNKTAACCEARKPGLLSRGLSGWRAIGIKSLGISQQRPNKALECPFQRPLGEACTLISRPKRTLREAKCSEQMAGHQRSLNIMRSCLETESWQSRGRLKGKIAMLQTSNVTVGDERMVLAVVVVRLAQDVQPGDTAAAVRRTTNRGWRLPTPCMASEMGRQWCQRSNRCGSMCR